VKSGSCDGGERGTGEAKMWVVRENVRIQR
jgi:hypothetical protein